MINHNLNEQELTSVRALIESSPGTTKTIWVAQRVSSQGWIAKDNTNAIYYYVNLTNGSPTPATNCYQNILPTDYKTNSQITLKIYWGSSSEVVAGKSTTFQVAWGVHKVGQTMTTLTLENSVAENSPHTATKLISTTLCSPTLTASAGDLFCFAPLIIHSDTSFYRFYEGFSIEYQVG